MRGLNKDLLQLAEEAGVESVVLDYLRARKALSKGILGAMAQNWDEVDQLLVKPLVDGHTHEGVTYKVTEAEATLAKAQIRYLWKVSHDQLANPTPASTTPGAPAPSASGQTSSKQPPKELPPEVFRELLAKYEDQMIDGAKREFPQRMLLGCERIIARIWWEMTHRMHTPIQLHELLATRVFDAAGNPNPLARESESKQNKVTLDLTSGQGTVLCEEATWSPKGVLSLLDAMEAIEWALILVRMGTEPEVKAWTTWWRCLIRSKTQKLEQIKAYWLEANWKLCLELRQGGAFSDITKTIMHEQHSLQNALQTEVPAPMPKMKPAAPKAKNEPYRPNPNQGKGGNKRWYREDSWQPRQDKNPDNRYGQSHKTSGGTGGYPTA